jgi:hypothetical protein
MSESNDICGEEKNDGTTCTFSPKYSDGKCGHHTETKETNTGRPSKLKENKEVIQLIGDEIERGATINEALAEVEQKTGITIARSTHGNWMAKGAKEDSEGIFKEYRTEITRARNMAARTDRRNLINKCRETDDTRTWWKVHQQQYGDLYADETVDDDARPVFNVPEDIVEEWQPVKQ